MKLLLQQDDCAPDALQFFNREFKKETGLCLGDFKSRAKLLKDKFEYKMSWIHNGYELEVSADDPYYKLYKL